jgi:hypothetical protein
MKALLLPLALLATSADGLEIVFRNLCGKDMLLSNGKTGETIKKDGSVKKTLAVGAVEAFRYGSSGQATRTFFRRLGSHHVDRPNDLLTVLVAEFSVQATTTWYDIGIIPTGTLIGVRLCPSPSLYPATYHTHWHRCSRPVSPATARVWNTARP